MRENVMAMVISKTMLIIIMIIILLLLYDDNANNDSTNNNIYDKNNIINNDKRNNANTSTNNPGTTTGPGTAEDSHTEPQRAPAPPPTAFAMAGLSHVSEWCSDVLASNVHVRLNELPISTS